MKENARWIPAIILFAIAFVITFIPETTKDKTVKAKSLHSSNVFYENIKIHIYAYVRNGDKYKTVLHYEAECSSDTWSEAEVFMAVEAADADLFQYAIKSLREESSDSNIHKRVKGRIETVLGWNTIKKSVLHRIEGDKFSASCEKATAKSFLNILKAVKHKTSDDFVLKNHQTTNPLDARIMYSKKEWSIFRKHTDPSAWLVHAIVHPISDYKNE